MDYSFGKVETIEEYSGGLCGIEIKDKIAGCMTEVALSSFKDIFDIIEEIYHADK